MANAIKIYDDIWIIKQVKHNYKYDEKTNSYEEVSKNEEDLAYMCQHGNDSAFKKRKETGISWSRNDIHPDGHIFKNEPLEGFKLGRSVSRYSTDNKVFRLEDPRGFTVEISTGNLEMLMRDVTIIKGVIQGKCVWGREDKNILLSVDSEPYKNAFNVSDKLLSVKDLEVGDKVLMQNGREYVYAGSAALQLEVPVCIFEYDDTDKVHHNSRYKVVRNAEVSIPQQHYFLSEFAYRHYDYTKWDNRSQDGQEIDSYITFSSPKISKIVSKGNSIGKFDATCNYENANQNIPGYNDDKIRAACGLCTREESNKEYEEFNRTRAWGYSRGRHNPEFVWESGRKVKKITYK